METSEAEQTQIKTRPDIAGPAALELFYSPPGTLRLTVSDSYSYAVVKSYLAAPLSMPGQHIALQNGKGEEIALVPSIDEFSVKSRQTVDEELKRRYLTSKVHSVKAIRTEFGVTYWNVETDRGPRDFVIQSLSESCVWLSDRHILLIDVDGNRFDISDRTLLDSASRDRLDGVL